MVGVTDRICFIATGIWIVRHYPQLRGRPREREHGRGRERGRESGRAHAHLRGVHVLGCRVCGVQVQQVHTQPPQSWVARHAVLPPHVPGVQNVL